MANLHVNLGALAVRKIPEEYVIIEMYNTSRNERHKPVSGGLLSMAKFIGP